MENWDLVRVAATRYGLDAHALMAQVLHESSNDPAAIRFEPNYRWTWPAPLRPGEPRIIYPIRPCSKDTESVAQRVSWGLLQVMGAVARELGFRGPFLAELARDAALGLDFGARHLRNKLRAYGELAKALSAYNAGSPTAANRDAYVGPILASAERLRTVLA